MNSAAPGDVQGVQRTEPSQLLCPSAPASEGAILLSIRDQDGVARYPREQLPVTKVFLELARSGTTPGLDARFRFASPCQQSACAQWLDGGCSLPGKLVDLKDEGTQEAGLPRCSIRGSCRWFSQSGAAACAICPSVTRTENE